jgi:hypothetical protein
MHEHLSDDAFLARFERAGFAAHEFPHRAHLRMAYLYVRRLGPVAAADRVAAGILHLATAHGHRARYNETLSRAWVQVVALAMQRTGAESFEALLAAHPALLDKHLLLAHYSRGLLYGPQAREQWVAPDLVPIPAV